MNTKQHRVWPPPARRTRSQPPAPGRDRSSARYMDKSRREPPLAKSVRLRSTTTLRQFLDEVTVPLSYSCAGGRRIWYDADRNTSRHAVNGMSGENRAHDDPSNHRRTSTRKKRGGDGRRRSERGDRSARRRGCRGRERSGRASRRARDAPPPTLGSRKSTAPTTWKSANDRAQSMTRADEPARFRM